MAFSRSWTANALPVRSTSTQPSWTSRARAASPPEWTIAGPATTTIFSPFSLVLRISRAVPLMAMPLLISAEMSFDMKPNTDASRLRSGGRTRMPWPRKATGSPFLTCPCFTQRGAPSRCTIAQSIFWSCTSVQRPPTLTRVSKLVVE